MDLAAVGILALAVGGINKLTMVVGPWFFAASVSSLLRQTGKLEIDREVPILTIALGCLLLLVQILEIPLPEFVNKNNNKKKRQKR